MIRTGVSRILPLLLGAFLLLGHGCHRRPVFDAGGIYFEIAEEWVLQGSELDEDGGRVRCKRRGLGATFELTVSWYEAAPDPGTLLSLLQESLHEEWVYRDVEFAAPEPGIFRGMPSLESRFTFPVLGEPYSGAFVIFRCSGRTVCIYYQQADEERPLNADPLERFSSTFRCSRSYENAEQTAGA